MGGGGGVHETAPSLKSYWQLIVTDGWGYLLLRCPCSWNSKETQLGLPAKKKKKGERKRDRLEMEGKTSQEEEGISGNGKEMGDGNRGEGPKYSVYMYENEISQLNRHAIHHWMNQKA